MSKKGYKQTEEHRKKIAKAHIGMRLTDTIKAKIRTNRKGKGIGSRNGSWKGGITPILKKLRSSVEYRLWREAVFKRDNYTCIWCGDNRGGNLHADHIKQFAFYPELRFAIDNGRTLCISCHKKTDTYLNNKTQ